MPYLSVVLLLIVTLGRYLQEPAAFTSSSTQFLEGKKLPAVAILEERAKK